MPSIDDAASASHRRPKWHCVRYCGRKQRNDLLDDSVWGEFASCCGVNLAGGPGERCRGLRAWSGSRAELLPVAFAVAPHRIASPHPHRIVAQNGFACGTAGGNSETICWTIRFEGSLLLAVGSNLAGGPGGSGLVGLSPRYCSLWRRIASPLRIAACIAASHRRFASPLRIAASHRRDRHRRFASPLRIAASHRRFASALHRRFASPLRFVEPSSWFRSGEGFPPQPLLAWRGEGSFAAFRMTIASGWGGRCGTSECG